MTELHHRGGDAGAMRDVQRYAGVNAAIATPMTPDLDLDLEGLRRSARWIADAGVIAVTVNADTGEGALLTVEERVRVIETVKDEIGGRVRVVSGLIAPSTAQAVAVSRELVAAGADELLIFSPSAFAGSPLPPELVYGYYAAVGEVGVPLIGFSLTPTLGGVLFEPDVIERLADVPALAAVKEASFDPINYVRGRDALRAAAPDVALLSGCDNFMAESFMLGADGCLLGYAGLAPKLTREVLEHARAGRFEEAQRLGREAMDPLARIVFGAPVRNSRARVKEGLRMLGLIDCAVVRPPLLALDDRECAALRAAMQTAGLLDARAA